jgi:hypothetical protein
MKKFATARGVQFILGVIVGAVVFGGIAAYAAGIIAQPKTAAVVIDDQSADPEGSLTEDDHDSQLGDPDEKLLPDDKEFSVADEENNRALTDTSRSYDTSEQLPQTATPDSTFVSTPAPTPTPTLVPTPDSTATPTPTPVPTPIPTLVPTTVPATSGYGYTFSPLKTGDIIKTAPVDSAKGSVGGDYTIRKGCEDKPWKTADGTVWPNVPLTAWQSAWDSYPLVSFPTLPPVHFTGDVRGTPYDTLLVLNPYEIERMVRTIYKYAAQNPSLWQNHDPATNIPNFSIKITYTDDMVYNTFYPWRDWEIEKFVAATGDGTEFRVYAYDSYNNGLFNDTEYFLK